MKKWLSILVLVIIGLSSQVYGQSEANNTLHKAGLYGELGGRGDPDAIGGEIGISAYITENLSLRAGLAFLASESFDDIFGGTTLGVRYNVNARLSPFVGIGMFAGYSEETVSAEDDYIDNDEDGYIDEYGEKKEVLNDVIASIYPEIGIHLWITDTERLTFTSKYHVTTEGREHDFWIFNFGIAFGFD